MGYQGWIMDYIMQIVLLRHWKDKEISKASLSLAELARKAFSIERNLRRDRENILHKIIQNTIAPLSERNIELVTNVFASAALVYLHTIISDPRPEVSEIQQGIAETIDAIRLLQDPTLLDRLVWPICISACLARSDSWAFFERLEKGLLGDRNRNLRVLRTFEIARRCQSLREQSVSNQKAFDWTDSMRSMNAMQLLF